MVSIRPASLRTVAALCALVGCLLAVGASGVIHDPGASAAVPIDLVLHRVALLLPLLGYL